MDIRKVTTASIGLGAIVVSVAVIWWGTAYGFERRAIECLAAGSLQCSVVAPHYFPLLFWIGVIMVTMGYAAGVVDIFASRGTRNSEYESANQIDDIIKLVVVPGFLIPGAFIVLLAR